MSEEAERRTLVVANRTASTPVLLAEVKRRAAGGATFALLIPAERGEHVDWTPDDACRLLGEACGSEIERVDAGEDAGATIRDLIEEGRYAEILVSTAPEHHVRWRHHDLPHKVQHFGVPVMVIPPEPNSWAPIEGFPPEWSPHAVGGPGAY
jgi:hypothetical protein